MAATRVLIIGAGRLGLALAGCLQRGHQATVSLWDKNPSVRPGSLPLHLVAYTADVVLLAIPTDSIRETLNDTGLHVHSRTIFGLLSKGLESKTGLTAAEVAEQTLPARRNWAFIGGPMVAEEIRAGVRGQAILAGPGSAVITTLEAIFPPETMAFSPTGALARHVALAGVLKNVYAVVYGLGVGLNWTPTELSALWKRCEVELLIAGQQCGIEAEVMSGLAGLADFRATGGSAHSRNRQAGTQFASTGIVDRGAEGIHALPLLLRRWPKLSRLEGVHGLQAMLSTKPSRPSLQSFLLR